MAMKNLTSLINFLEQAKRQLKENDLEGLEISLTQALGCTRNLEAWLEEKSLKEHRDNLLTAKQSLLELLQNYPKNSKDYKTAEDAIKTINEALRRLET